MMDHKQLTSPWQLYDIVTQKYNNFVQLKEQTNYIEYKWLISKMLKQNMFANNTHTLDNI